MCTYFGGCIFGHILRGFNVADKEVLIILRGLILRSPNTYHFVVMLTLGEKEIYCKTILICNKSKCNPSFLAIHFIEKQNYFI